MNVTTQVSLLALVVAGALAGCTSTASVEIAPEGNNYGETPPIQTDGVDDGGILGDGSLSTKPMLAYIDPNASMTQTPGNGVGVFTQYDSTSSANPGGHWYVWWTCDTNLSSLPCDYTISVSAKNGVRNVVSQNFVGSDSLTGTGTLGDGGAAGADAGTRLVDAAALETGVVGHNGLVDGGFEALVDGGVHAQTGADGGSFATPTSLSFTANTTTTNTVQGVHFDTDPGATITLTAALSGQYSGSFLFFVEDGKVNGGYAGLLTDPLELEPSSP